MDKPHSLIYARRYFRDTPDACMFRRPRGLVGIAFRLQTDRDPNGSQTYDAFYLRPTNGHAEDQERRNHSVQYISHPDWTWSRLRREAPSRYEAYVDLLPDTWTKIRIDVRGAQARLWASRRLASDHPPGLDFRSRTGRILHGDTVQHHPPKITGAVPAGPG